MLVQHTILRYARCLHFRSPHHHKTQMKWHTFQSLKTTMEVCLCEASIMPHLATSCLLFLVIFLHLSLESAWPKPPQEDGNFCTYTTLYEVMYSEIQHEHREAKELFTNSFKSSVECVFEAQFKQNRYCTQIKMWLPYSSEITRTTQHNKTQNERVHHPSRHVELVHNKVSARTIDFCQTERRYPQGMADTELPQPLTHFNSSDTRVRTSCFMVWSTTGLLVL